VAAVQRRRLGGSAAAFQCPPYGDRRGGSPWSRGGWAVRRL